MNAAAFSWTQQEAAKDPSIVPASLQVSPPPRRQTPLWSVGVPSVGLREGGPCGKHDRARYAVTVCRLLARLSCELQRVKAER